MKAGKQSALIAAALLLSFPLSLAADPKKEQAERAALIGALPQWHLLEPIGSSPIVRRESTTPMQTVDGGPVVGRLALPAEEIIQVRSADGARTFRPGVDVKLESDGVTLTFESASSPPWIMAADLYPPASSGKGYRHRVGKPEENLLYSEGHWFHDRQVEVDYRPKPGTTSPPKFSSAKGSLPRTLARLRAGQPLTLGVSGDSISQGYNASGFTGAPPRMPPFPDLVAAQLESTYRSPVVLKNRAIAGWSIANGLTDLDKLLAEKPHLILVAYGMNDVGRRDPKWFRGQVETFIARVRLDNPDVELILVAPMLGNAEWVHTPREMFTLYRDALASLVGPGVAFADVTSAWEWMLRSKRDLDLIGNGLNHPNDFGHRLYARTILASLIPSVESSPPARSTPKR